MYVYTLYPAQVSFYVGCDATPQVVKFERSPDDMELDGKAGVFVGQAGGADPDKFLVRCPCCVCVCLSVFKS